jgi:hypothetical protein
MKKLALVAAMALALGGGAALAQTPNEAPKLSVETTPIGEIIKVPEAKAALEKVLPEIADYYDQIGDMTLAGVAPMSQGALNETNLKELQAEFDKIK